MSETIMKSLQLEAGAPKETCDRDRYILGASSIQLDERNVNERAMLSRSRGKVLGTIASSINYALHVVDFLSDSNSCTSQRAPPSHLLPTTATTFVSRTIVRTFILSLFS